MLFKLLILFITVPLIELFVLLWVGRLTGVWTTIALVLVTGFFGAFIAKQQGWMAWWRLRQALFQGRLPTREIADTVLIVFASALLLTPGLLTDLFGFLILIPSTRQPIREWLIRRLTGRVKVRLFGTRPASTAPGKSAPTGKTVEGSVKSTRSTRIQ